MNSCGIHSVDPYQSIHFRMKKIEEYATRIKGDIIAGLTICAIDDQAFSLGISLKNPMNKNLKTPNVMVHFGWADPEGFEAITNYALQRGWHLNLRTYFTDSVPVNWNGDGIIYSKGNRERVDRFILKQSARCPVVVINSNRPAKLKAPIVGPDNVEAGRRAALHLIERGCRDFAFFSTASGEVSSERRTGFEETVREAGYGLHEIRILLNGKSSLTLEKQQALLVKEIKKLPLQVGVLALDDLVAADFVEAAQKSGRRVPQDIAIVGLGNIRVVCESSPLPITSIDLQQGEVARQAAVLLDGLMAGGARPAQPVRIAPGVLFARESSDVTVVRDPRLMIAIGYIRSRLKEPFSIDEAADAAQISRRTLYQLMGEHLDTTPADYVRRERAMLATRLLQQRRGLTLQEVARLAGFSCTRTLTRTLAEE